MSGEKADIKKDNAVDTTNKSGKEDNVIESDNRRRTRSSTRGVQPTPPPAKREKKTPPSAARGARRGRPKKDADADTDEEKAVEPSEIKDNDKKKEEAEPTPESTMEVDGKDDEKVDSPEPVKPAKPAEPVKPAEPAPAPPAPTPAAPTPAAPTSTVENAVDVKAGGDTKGVEAEKEKTTIVELEKPSPVNSNEELKKVNAVSEESSKPENAIAVDNTPAPVVENNKTPIE